jgi:hypothetical protein
MKWNRQEQIGRWTNFPCNFRSQKDEQKRNESFFLEQIRYLGRVYDYETEDQHLMTVFQKILDVININSLNQSTSANQHFQSIMERVIMYYNDW